MGGGSLSISGRRSCVVCGYPTQPKWPRYHVLDWAAMFAISSSCVPNLVSSSYCSYVSGHEGRQVTGQSQTARGYSFGNLGSGQRIRPHGRTNREQDRARLSPCRRLRKACMRSVAAIMCTGESRETSNESQATELSVIPNFEPACDRMSTFVVCGMPACRKVLFDTHSKLEHGIALWLSNSACAGSSLAFSL